MRSEVEQELPGLRLLAVTEVQVARAGPLTGESPRDIKRRLRELSNRYRGARAVSLRREPIPAAYRVFFRHIGLDPDIVRTPIEAAGCSRAGDAAGGALSRADPSGRGVPLIALVDTGVPGWALDAGSSLDRELGIHARAAKPEASSGAVIRAGRCRPDAW